MSDKNNRGNNSKNSYGCQHFNERKSFIFFKLWHIYKIKLKIFTLKKNTIINPIIRNGANGISLFIVNRFFCKYNDEINASPTPKKAPIQKDSVIAENPADKPSIHPIPQQVFHRLNQSICPLI